jgi:3-hydroxybutyryl-CoA dehydrogenase
LIKKEKFKPEERQSTLSRIHPTGEYDLFKGADLVVEAVLEDLEVKKNVFKELDKICNPECFFASNTSSISITMLATSVGIDRIGQFLGAHFFLPPR